MTEFEPMKIFENDSLLCGQYRIIATLSATIAGTVYLCQDETTGENVVLRHLPSVLFQSEEDIQKIKDAVQPLFTLNHKNIAACRQLQKDPDTGEYFLISDYVNGIDLTEWTKQKKVNGVLPPHEIVPVIKQIADALDYAHSQQVVHRDLKPENIMIEADGTVRLLDFFITAEIRECMALHTPPGYGETKGNPPYVAPEQWRESRIYANSDQYALGILIYELLADELPYKCTRQTSPAIHKELTITEEPEPIDGVSQAVWDVVARMVKKDPADRFPTCKNIAFTLERLLPPPQPELPEPTEIIPPKKKFNMLIFILLFGICGGIVGWILKNLPGAITGAVSGIVIGFLLGLLCRKK